MSTQGIAIKERRPPEALQPSVRRYAALCRELAGDNLLGITLYGAVLDSGYRVGSGAAQSVMVLGRMDLAMLRRLSEYGPELGRAWLAAPQVFTPQDIEGSRDTFPLELLEICQCRATIAGKDHFADLEFSPEHVRLQCEREFRRIRIRLAQGLLMTASREEPLAELEVDVGRHLLRVLRGLLWLKGEPDYVAAEDAVRRCGEICGRPLDGVRRAIRFSGEHGWQEFVALHEDAEALAASCDGL